MRKYISVSRMAFKEALAYKSNIIFKILTNISYVLLTYFLWKSVYKTTDQLNGMSFQETFLYLALANTIFILFQNWTEWSISDYILTGDIVHLLLKPYNFLLYWLFYSLGVTLQNVVMITLPSFLALIFFFKISFPPGIYLLFFLISFFFAYLVNTIISNTTSLTTFYTESSWGVSAAKEAVVLLLSGAVIPLAFFPSPLKEIIKFLPFQAIYDAPLRIFIGKDMTIADFLLIIVIQALWLVILYLLNVLLYRKVIKIITINGG